MERIDTDTNKKSNSNTNFSHTKQTGSATCMSTTTSRTADDWSCIAGHMSAAVGPPKDLPQYRSFSEDLTLDGTQDPDWLQKKTELYLPPPQFSCFDSPISCVYRDPPVYRRADYQAPVKTGHITVDRKRRAHFAISLNFDAPEVPNKPLPKALENMKQYGDQTVLETLQKMYESRPIWSRNALCHKLRVPSMDLRYLLPCVVYYFNTGPWRTLGIRLGYDPRKDINSKIYQIVDFRLTRRPQHILEQLRLETYNRYRQTSRVSTRVRQRSVKECHFRFSPSVLPGYKQMFYQLVEIDLQAVQDIVNENKGKEKNCTERDGWCVENYQSRCRVKMLDSLEPLIRSIDAKKEKKGEEDSGSSSDDYDDDEDEIEVREDASDQEEGEEEDDDDEEAEEDDEEEDEEDELHVRQDEILSDILSSMQTWQHGT